LQKGVKRPVSQVRFVSPQAKLRWGGTEPGAGSPERGAGLALRPAPVRCPVSCGARARQWFRLQKKTKPKQKQTKKIPKRRLRLIKMLRALGESNPRDRNPHPSDSEIAFLIEIASNPGRLRSWLLLFFFFPLLPRSLSTPKQKEDKEGNFARTTTTTTIKK